MIPNYTYFVTQTFLQENAMFAENIDALGYTPLVQVAAKSFIKPILGTYFFDDLLVKYNNQTLNQNEEILVEKMQYSIGWRVAAEGVISLTYQLKNKGVQTQSGDNSVAPEDRVIWKLSDHYIQKAILHQNEIIDYLVDNYELFPAFNNKLNYDSTITNRCNKNNNGGDYQEGTGLYFI